MTEVMNIKEPMLIQIRFNTPYPKNSTYKWRLLRDGKEILLIDHARFEVPTYTTEDEVLVAGNTTLKCHITCKANQLIVVEDDNNQEFTAIIK